MIDTVTFYKPHFCFVKLYVSLCFTTHLLFELIVIIIIITIKHVLGIVTVASCLRTKVTAGYRWLLLYDVHLLMRWPALLDFVLVILFSVVTVQF
jgi:hypothetical protein